MSQQEATQMAVPEHTQKTHTVAALTINMYINSSLGILSSCFDSSASI